MSGESPSSLTLQSSALRCWLKALLCPQVQSSSIIVQCQQGQRPDPQHTVTREPTATLLCSNLKSIHYSAVRIGSTTDKEQHSRQRREAEHEPLLSTNPSSLLIACLTAAEPAALQPGLQQVLVLVLLGLLPSSFVGTLARGLCAFPLQQLQGKQSHLRVQVRCSQLQPAPVLPLVQLLPAAFAAAPC